MATTLVILGPMLLATSAFRLWSRSNASARETLQTRLSSVVGFDVDFDKVEFVRPGIERFVDASLSFRDVDDPFLYCPEIYIIHNQNDPSLSQFAQSFDRYSNRKTAGVEEVESDELSIVDSNADSSFYSLVTRANKTENLPKESLAIVIPTAYCRDSRITEAQSVFRAFFYDARDRKYPENKETSVGIVISSLAFQNDDVFKRRSTRRDRGAVPALDRNKALESYKAAVLSTSSQVSEERGNSTQREVIAFSSEPPVVENIRALFFSNRESRRFDVLYELQKITSSAPFYLSFEAGKTKNGYFEFNTANAPTPGCFASRFVPYLEFLGNEGYFYGTIVSSTAADSGFDAPISPNATPTTYTNQSSEDQIWRTRLVDFHLRQFNLQSISEKYDMAQFSGTISDLTIENGIVSRGIFLGKGSTTVKNGTLPVETVRKMCRLGMLETSPPRAASLRFINDATPFNELEIQFVLDENGVTLDSSYRNKIVAFYQYGDVKYGLYLSQKFAGAPHRYYEIFNSAFGGENSQIFWTPFTRSALNHLPATKPINSNPTESEQN